MHDYYATSGSFRDWADRRRSDPRLTEDAAMASRCSQWVTEQKPTEKKPAGSRRGRPELSTINPVVSVMPFLSFDRPQWVDDIVYGSVATGAGVSRGRLNIRPGCVLAALHLEVVSAGAIKTVDMSVRSAQTIAKAARHAAHGIAFYLDRHPTIRARLALE